MDENFSINKIKKEIMQSTGTGRHVEKEYTLIGDVVSEDGVRTITMKEKDLSEEIADRKKLIGLLLEKLGEPPRGLMGKLLNDTLLDRRYSAVKDMIRAIESGKPVSKAPTHCFRLHIGDGRKKSSFCLALRD